MSGQRTIAIPPSALGKYERRMRSQLRVEIPGALRRAGRRGVALLRERSSKIKDLGMFQVGWAFKVTFADLMFWNKAPHSIYVESGRRPGARPPPVQAIVPWAVRHGFEPGAAYAIAKNIGKRGIRARPVLRNPAVFERLDEMVVDELVTAWDLAARRSS